MFQQSSPQGIASLYMGNPGALQKKVQTEQKANPGLPPDLKNLMALNIVTNEQDAAKRQSAMNALNSMAPAGQQPPTVAQSLQAQAKQKLQAQMLQQQRQQQGIAALAKQQPSPEVPEGTRFAQAQPEAGIDQLPVEMGLAGGGIVAFAGGDEVYETSYDRMNRENREREERDRAERLARIEAEGGSTASYGEQMRGLGRFIDQFVPDPIRLARRIVSDPTLAREEAAAQLPQAPYSNESRRQPTVPAQVMPQGAPAMQGAPNTSRASAPRPTGQPAGIAAAAPAGQGDQYSLAAAQQAVLKQAMEQMGRKPDEAFAEGAERSRKYVGLDDLIKSKEGRISEAQARYEAAKAGRAPEWVKGLAALGGAPVRGGLGMMLGRAGAAAEAAREGYSAEDLKFADTIDKMRDDVLKAQIEGRYKDAAAGEAAIRDLTANKRQAEQSVTSMANTEEQARTRRQIAADNAAARAASQADVLEQRKISTAINAIKNDEVINSLQKQLEAAMKLPTQANQAQVRMLRDEIGRRQAAIYKQFGVSMPADTMAAAPGASSPGGNTRMRFDAQGNLVK